MANSNDYSKELARPDELALIKASRGLHQDWAGRDRYSFYRRKGHGPAAALRFALAWCRNARDQKSRRLDHGTGAVNWR